MRNVVILSAAKDLYEMCTNNILSPSSYLGPMTIALSCNLSRPRPVTKNVLTLLQVIRHML